MWPWQYPMVRGVPPSSQGQDYEVQFVPIIVPRSSSTRVEPTLMPQVPPPGFRMQSPSVVTETVNPWGIYNPMMSPYFATPPGAYADYLRLSASALHHSVVTDSSQVLPDAPVVASSVVTDPSQDLPSAPSVVSSVVTDLFTTVSSASSVAPSVMTDSPSLSSVPQTVPAVPAMPVSAAVASLPPAEDASLPVPPSVSSVEDMVDSGSTTSHGPAVASPSPSQKDLSTSVVSGTVSSAPLSSEDRPLQRPLPARSPHSPHLTSAKRVRSGGDRVPGPMSLVRDDSAASGGSSTPAPGRHARSRQPCPFERCQFFTERRSRHLIQYHLPWFAVPQSACFECGANFVQQGRLYIHLRERHHFRPHELADYSLNRLDTYVMHMSALLNLIASRIGLPSLDVQPTTLLSFLDDCIPFTGFLPDDPFFIALTFVVSDRYNLEVPSELCLTPPNHLAALFHWHLVSELLLMLPYEDQRLCANFVPSSVDFSSAMDGASQGRRSDTAVSRHSSSEESVPVSSVSSVEELSVASAPPTAAVPAATPVVPHRSTMDGHVSSTSSGQQSSASGRRDSPTVSPASSAQESGSSPDVSTPVEPIFQELSRPKMRHHPYGLWPPEHPGYVTSYSRDDYVVDAHFHVDHLVYQNNLPHHQTINEFARSTGVDDEFLSIPFMGGVASYLVQIGDHRHTYLRSPLVSSCYGVHPKHAMLYNPEEQKLALARVMEAIHNDESVVAIGEIGLDYFHASQAVNVFVARERQRDMFFDMLRAAQNDSYLSGLPLVLHIRDVSLFKDEAALDCINLLQIAGVPQDHPIYLHCFNCSLKVARRWISAFPRVHFGLSPKALSPKGSHPDLPRIFRDIASWRILVETDAPLLKIGNASPVTPFHISVMYNWIALLRGKPLGVTLRGIAESYHLFYNIPPPKLRRWVLCLSTGVYFHLVSSVEEFAVILCASKHLFFYFLRLDILTLACSPWHGFWLEYCLFILLIYLSSFVSFIYK